MSNITEFIKQQINDHEEILDTYRVFGIPMDSDYEENLATAFYSAMVVQKMYADLRVLSTPLAAQSVAGTSKSLIYRA